MKMQSVPVTGMALTAGLLLGLSGAASAQGMNDGGMASDQQSRFIQMDADGDGTISRSEAQGDPNLVDNFQSADTNGDGQIDEGEFAQFEVEQQTPPGTSPSEPGSSGMPGGPGGMESEPGSP